MDDIKYFASPCGGDEGTGWAVGDVDNDARVSEVYLFKVETGTCLARNALVVGVERLITGHLLEVDVEMADCVYDAHQIFLLILWNRELLGNGFPAG